MRKAGKNTLIWSVIMSAPGPLVVGIGLIIGRSSTQIADFVRRSIELLSIIMAFVVYSITSKDEKYDLIKKEKLERNTNVFVGFSMIVAGIIMLALALFFPSENKGNVIPGLCIALLGVIANTIFWIRYRYLAKKENNAILDVQSKLYRAKSLVDICVTIALVAILVAPLSKVSYYLDLIGSIIVSIYLILSGIKIIYDKLKKKKEPYKPNSKDIEFINKYKKIEEENNEFLKELGIKREDISSECNRFTDEENEKIIEKCNKIIKKRKLK